MVRLTLVFFAALIMLSGCGSPSVTVVDTEDTGQPSEATRRLGGRRR